MRVRSILSLLLALTLALAACGGGDDTASADREEDDGSPTSEAVSDSDFDTDAVLRYADNVGPNTFDPHKSPTSSDATAMFLVYDRLVHLSPDAEVVPGLAESWEYSDDGLELTLHLREGVTFQDGATFDADAVKANLDRALTVEGSTAASSLGSLESVEVVDPLTVVLHLTQPDASLVTVLSDRAGAMISPEALDDPTLDQNPVGAGMYKVTSYEPGSKIVYEAWDGYWDPDAVKLAGVELYVMADDARANAIRTGQLDLTWLPPVESEQAEDAGLRVERFTTLLYGNLFMNRSVEPFDNADVRRAINLAIDREAIVEGLLLGMGEPAVQPFPEGYWAHNPDYPADYFAYDPEEAKRLLAEAGYADGFSFEMIVPNSGEYIPVAEAVQAQLREVGVDAEIQILDASQVGTVVFAEQSADSMLAGWGGRPDPSMTLGLRTTANGFSNPGRHSTDRNEELHAQALATFDPDERAKVIQEQVAEVVEQGLEITLYFPMRPQVMTDKVLGFQGYRSGMLEFRGVGLAAG